MSEIIIDVTNKGGNDLPGDKRAKLCGKIGGSIFLLEEKTVKSDVLKTPIKFRSYREVRISKAEMHTGKGGEKGLMMNGDLFMTAKSCKFAGEGGESSNKNEGNNNGNETTTFLIALDQKTARKHAIDFNILQREAVRGMINSLQNTVALINDVIDADTEGTVTID
mgnify:CR=1 FL=1